MKKFIATLIALTAIGVAAKAIKDTHRYEDKKLGSKVKKIERAIPLDIMIEGKVFTDYLENHY